MINLYLHEIIKQINGEIIGNIDDFKIISINTDSRKIDKDHLFVPLIGENFDGHSFCLDCVLKGAVTLSEKKLDLDNYILVKSTHEAIKQMASYILKKKNIPIVAITGSTGKTTTKEMISTVLSQKYKVHKTNGNFNNEIGLPLTVFNLEEQDEIIVLEMGMNSFGEIHNLSKTAPPNLAVITNVGVSHIGNLGSRKGILSAKMEITDYMENGETLIINGDDDMLNTVNCGRLNLVKYGKNNNWDSYFDNVVDNGIDGICADLHYFNREIHVMLKSSGIHMLYNGLCAMIIGAKLGLTDEQIKNGLETPLSLNMRMEKIIHNNITIIKDCYNANPNSMKVAIDVLASCKGSKMAILGDMFELGENEKMYHKEIGEYLLDKNIDIILICGNISASMYQVFVDNNIKNVHYFPTQEELIIHVLEYTNNIETILIKASRGMELEKTLNKIIK